MPLDPGPLFARRTAGMRPSAVRDVLRVSGDPGVISLAGGLPAPELFPVEEFRAAFDRVLRERGTAGLQYGLSEGWAPLRELVAERLTRRGMDCTADRVLITNGSQQALDLIGKVFLDPGDRVAIERPSYLGAIQAFNQYQVRYLAIGQDEEGLAVDELEAHLEVGGSTISPAGVTGTTKLVYAQPTFQNPSGRTMSRARREWLLDLAGRNRVLVVEDDPYGELRYDGEDVAPLAALDREGIVLHVGTFSKILAPGLRLGWLVVPKALYRTLVLAKQPSDLHTATLPQMVAWQLARDGFLERHIGRVRAFYRERRDALLEALDRQLPAGVRVTRPNGGLFVWAELPLGCDTDQLLLRALRERVAFVPGGGFFVDGSGANTMRLTFATAPPDDLREGVRRLAGLLGGVGEESIARP